MAFDIFAQIGDVGNIFSMVDVLTALLLSTLLGLVVTTVYQKTHDGLSYSKNFTQTILILGVVVSMIMMIIGSNIARAFTLLGALSIVRFRNPIKETKDLGYIFLMMAVGMAVGTRFYLIAIIMTLFVSLLAVLMYKFEYGSRKYVDEILKVEMPDKYEFNGPFSKIFQKYLNNHELMSIESTEKSGFNEAVFLVRFKARVDKNDLVKEVKELIPEGKVYLMGTDHIIY